MKQLDLDQFTAVNNAGGTNASYPWVEAIVRLMRPIVGLIALGTWAYLQLVHQSTPAVENFAACIGFYLFGDRTLFYSRNGK